MAKLTWPGPMVVDDFRFLKRHTRHPTKMTVIGPLTAACRVLNEYYFNEEALGMDVACAIRNYGRCRLKALTLSN